MFQQLPWDRTTQKTLEALVTVTLQGAGAVLTTPSQVSYQGPHGGADEPSAANGPLQTLLLSQAGKNSTPASFLIVINTKRQAFVVRGC